MPALIKRFPYGCGDYVCPMVEALGRSGGSIYFKSQAIPFKSRNTQEFLRPDAQHKRFNDSPMSRVSGFQGLIVNHKS